MLITARTALGLTVMACVLAGPANAAAATRYVGNPGTGGAPCTDAQNPCVLFTALDEADPGDTISIRRDPTAYDLPGGLTIDKRLRIVGAPGERPVFRFTGGAGFILAAGSAGSELRHLRIETPNEATAVNAQEQTTLADLDLDGSGSCVRFGAPNSELTDSKLATALTANVACIAAGPAASGLELRALSVTVTSPPQAKALDLDAAGIDASDLTIDSTGVGLELSGGAAAADTPSVLRRARITTEDSVALRVRRDEGGGAVVVSDVVARASGTQSAGLHTHGGPAIRNVTGIASGFSSVGLLVQVQNSSTPTTAVVRNSVFRGDESDVAVKPGEAAPLLPPASCFPVPPPCFGPPTHTTPLVLSHSNFRTQQGPLAAGSGSNQSGDPRFVNPSGGDFHVLAGSPLIDAGTADSANGPTDLDGRARTIGTAPDIGAYEFAPPPAPAPPSASDGGDPPSGAGGPSGPVPVTDLAAPQVSDLALTNRTFAVGSAATPVAARAKKGTTFRLTLSENATVAIGFERSEPGRRRGRRCVKQTSKNRKARKCKRWVKRGAIQRSASAGRVTIPFSGRIGRKALKTGSYRALVTAGDAAGNRSQQRTVAFRIVKR
jgi:hypothetical protein